jgi:hypothetical protein
MLAAGEPVQVSGHITPAVGSATVTICYTRPDNATIYRSTTSSPDGNYSDSYAVYYLGVWTVQSSWAGNEIYTGAESEVKNFTIGYLDLVPPLIRNVENIPVAPEYNQTVTVRAEVTDETTDVKLVVLSYSMNGTLWTNITMVSEGVYQYAANLTKCPWGITVYYKIYASDNANNWNISATYSYEPGDSAPPTIGSPQWGPENPSDSTDVYVSIHASEPGNASDLSAAFLIYQVNDEELHALQMTYDMGNWTVHIPRATAGATVKFFIRVYDNAYNVAVTPSYSYLVSGSGWNPLTPVITAGIIIGGAAAAILVWLKLKGKY